MEISPALTSGFSTADSSSVGKRPWKNDSIVIHNLSVYQQKYVNCTIEIEGIAINKKKGTRFILPLVGEDGEAGMRSRSQMCIKGAVSPPHGGLDPRNATLLRWREYSAM